MALDETPQAAANDTRKPDVSVVVVLYNMPREAPRTLYSLSADYQRQIEAADYEVIVIDNGSKPPFDPKVLENLSGNFRLIRIKDAPPSPGVAINRGLAEARGDVIGVMVDGARIATPGLLHFARHGARLYDKALVATLNWHLGSDFQGWAIQSGYDQFHEDALLESINWKKNGYRLFEIGIPDESSVDGWFQPLAESNAFFARKEIWAELNGVDEQFDAPGGGLINLDTFCRALQLPDAELVILLAEATFHQVHGGTSSNAPPDDQIANWLRWSSQYARIRGHPYELLRARRAPTYLGTLPRPALARIVRAAIHPSPMHPERALGNRFDQELWTERPPAKPADETVAEAVELAQHEFRHNRFTSACAVARLIRTRAPEEPEPQRLLSLVAPWLRPDGPNFDARPGYHFALAEAYRIFGEKELSATHYRNALVLQRPYAGPRIQYFENEQSSMHLPFAYELMRQVKPRTVVQLGLGCGDLYFAFCQAVAEHHIETHCYGIHDPSRLGQGNGSNAAIAPELIENNERYSGLSTLKSMPFMEAAAEFSNGSVDLLHLCEANSSGEAKRIFDAWLPKMSWNGIILLHDVVPRNYGGGISEFWNEIAQPGASFVFAFGRNLGVWRKGKFSERDPAWLRQLFGANAIEAKRINAEHMLTASALALWKSGRAIDIGEIADPLPIYLAADQKNPAESGMSIAKSMVAEGRQTIRFEEIEKLGRECRYSLRIDARQHAAFISFVSIQIVRARDGAVFYSAKSAADFEPIGVSRATLQTEEYGSALLSVLDAESKLVLPITRLPAPDSYCLEIVVDPTVARLTATEGDTAAVGVPLEKGLRLDVFHPVEEGYRDTQSQTRYFTEGSWQFFVINLPGRDKLSDLPFRIDPVNSPAVIEIVRVALKRPEAEVALWSAETQEEFDKFKIAGTASRLPHPKHLRILSFGSDPQILLPSSTIDISVEPLHLEISLLVHTAPETVRKCLSAFEAAAPHASSQVGVPQLKLSAIAENGPSNGLSLLAPFLLDEKQVIRFENIESICPARRCRFQIAPLYAPAFLKIFRLSITRDSDGFLFYAAESPEELDEIEVSKDVEKHIMDGNLLITAKTPSDHICLPVVDLPGTENCRLELFLEAHGAPALVPPWQFRFSIRGEELREVKELQNSY